MQHHTSGHWHHRRRAPSGAYAKRYAAPDVLLLYPHHAALGEWKPKRAAYLLNGLDKSDATLKQRISVSTVGLRDLGNVPSQLKPIVRA